MALDRTPLGHSLLALARVALTNDTEAGAEDLIEYLRGPGMADRADAVDRLESVVRRRALRTVAEARQRADFKLPEVDALRAAEDPGRSCSRTPAGCWRRRTATEPPCSTPAKSSTPARSGRSRERWPSSKSSGTSQRGPELIELLETLELPSGPPAGPGAVLLTDPLAIRARRFRAVLVCGLQENEFPLAPAPEPFLSDELRRELAACSGLRLRPREDALARECYPSRLAVPRTRTPRSRLPELRRGGEPRAALPVPGRRLRAARRGLARPAPAPDARRRRVAGGRGAHRAGAGARARGGARAACRRGPSPIGPLSEVALEHVRHRQILSAGALESYAGCPGGR